MPAVKRRRSTRGRKRGGCLPDATAHARQRWASNQLRMCREREAYPRLRPRIATMATSLARASSAVAGRSRGGVSSTDKTDRPHRAGLAVPQVLRRHDRLRTSTVLTKILCIAYRTRLAEGLGPSARVRSSAKQCAIAQAKKLPSLMTVAAFADNNPHQAWLPLDKIRKISHALTGRKTQPSDQDNGLRGIIG